MPAWKLKKKFFLSNDLKQNRKKEWCPTLLISWLNCIFSFVVTNLTVNVNVSIAIRSALKLHIEKEKLFLKILTPKNDEEKETLSNWKIMK